MMAQEPIPYTLADPADDVEHGLHPVNSAYHACRHSIGGHSPGCLADPASDIQGVLETAMAALTVAHNAAVLSAAPRKTLNRVMAAINSIAGALDDVAVR